MTYPETRRVWEMNGVGLENLHSVERPIPPPGPGEILIKVGAVSLNYKDKLTIEGRLPLRMGLPAIPLSDAAGTVVAVGDGAARFAPGDRVVTHTLSDWIDGPVPADFYTRTFGISLQGVLATHITIKETAAVAAPRSLDDVQASTLPTAALTAWSALVEDLRIRAGETVLIEGTGGVSLFGLAFASAIGAKAAVLAGGDRRAARAAAEGAWRTIDREATPDWEAAVREATEGRGVDAALEVVGGANVRRAIEVTANEGRIALIGIVDGPEIALNLSTIARRHLTLRGTAVGSRAAFERMNRAIDEWAVTPVIDTVHALADAPQAFARLSRRPIGKVVIRID